MAMVSENLDSLHIMPQDWGGLGCSCPWGCDKDQKGDQAVREPKRKGHAARGVRDVLLFQNTLTLVPKDTDCFTVCASAYASVDFIGNCYWESDLLILARFDTMFSVFWNQSEHRPQTTTRAVFHARRSESNKETRRMKYMRRLDGHQCWHYCCPYYCKTAYGNPHNFKLLEGSTKKLVQRMQAQSRTVSRPQRSPAWKMPRFHGFA